MSKKIYLGEIEILTTETDLNSLVNISSEVTLERFANKTILVSGDSITEANFRTTKNWHGYLHDWLGVTILNDGKSGTGIARPYGGSLGMYDRANTWDSTYTAFDAIIINGNMNDIGGATPPYLPLGSYGDATVETHFGVLKLLFERLITKFPNTPILFTTSAPRNTYGGGNGWGTTGPFEPYNAAIIRMCGEYSIPCLDLYHNSGLRPWNSTNNATYFSCDSAPTGDGIHPNALGHQIIAYKIYEFLKQYF